MGRCGVRDDSLPEIVTEIRIRKTMFFHIGSVEANIAPRHARNRERCRDPSPCDRSSRTDNPTCPKVRERARQGSSSRHTRAIRERFAAGGRFRCAAKHIVRGMERGESGLKARRCRSAKSPSRPVHAARSILRAADRRKRERGEDGTGSVSRDKKERIEL